ncbi:hypothetical protein [Phreatobacter sp.]|uniref:hypothetical protein n=1 Tax=Phreatobacter sp. TaxID=1966341 RepID=UPI003F72428C
MRLAVKTLATLAMLACTAASWTPAAAGPVFDRLSGPAADRDPCFARVYDADHLARNPRQRVERISLRRTRVEVPAENNARTFSVQLAFQLRGGDDSYNVVGICRTSGQRAECGGEGDAGAFRLSFSGEALRLEVVGRLEVEGERGASPDLARSDDRVFLLRPAAPAACVTDN